MKQIFCAVMLLVLVGCSGHIVTHKGIGSENCDSNGACKGVPFYVSEPMIEKREFTYSPGVGGKPARYATKSGDEKCNPVKGAVIVNRQSEDIRYISYKPGFFECAKFNVDLNPNGTLSKVGVEPSSGFKEAADAISSLATAYSTAMGPLGGTLAQVTPDCTAEAPSAQQLPPGGSAGGNGAKI